MYSSNKKGRIETLKNEYKVRIDWLDKAIKDLKPQRYDGATGTYKDL